MITRIELVSPSKDKNKEKWLVKLPCCGTEVVKRGDVIKDWEKGRTTRCRECNAEYMRNNGTHGMKQEPKMTDEARESARALDAFNKRSKAAKTKAKRKPGPKAETKSVWPTYADLIDRLEQDRIDAGISMIKQSSNHEKPWSGM